MTALGYPDASFDVVVSVFSIFFVTDMVAEVRKLWRVLRPGGKLSITTWGPRMFEPGSQAFWLEVKESRQNLVATVSPWERITSLGQMPCASFCWRAESKALRSPRRTASNRFSLPRISGPSYSVQATAGRSSR